MLSASFFPVKTVNCAHLATLVQETQTAQWSPARIVNVIQIEDLSLLRNP